MSACSIVLLYGRACFGIACMVLGIVRTHREPRRFSNAVLLCLGFVQTIQGLIQIWAYYFPGLMTDGTEQYIVTPAGDLLGLLTILYLLFIFFLGIGLIINGIRLMHKERVCLAHMLPLLFGVFCISYLVLDLPGRYFIRAVSETQAFYIARIVSFLRACALYVPFMVLAYFLYTWIYFIVRRRNYPDYIIVLGAKVIDGKASPLLTKRLDRGIALYNEWGKTPKFVVSGGQGADEICSEAEAMSAYLIEKGIRADQILLEDRSTNTYQNILFSKQLIEHDGGDGCYCSVVTNEYHVLRSVVCAHAVGLACNGYGCRTAGYYFPAAALRESIAFVFRYKKLALAAVGLFAANAAFPVLLRAIVR